MVQREPDNLSKMTSKKTALISPDTIPPLRKAAAAIHVSGELSLLERKLVNVLLLNAIDKISTQNVWQPDEYRLCADWLPLLEWSSLVGLGSVYLYLRAEPGHGPMLAITRRCVPHACRDCGPGARGVGTERAARPVGQWRRQRRATYTRAFAWLLAIRVSHPSHRYPATAF
ncbi:hypothetical protein PT2222_540003 [Paraburkholderia tropica]